MYWKVKITDNTDFCRYSSLCCFVEVSVSSRWSYTALQITEARLWSGIQLLYGNKRHADLRSSIQSRNMSGSWGSLCILSWGLEVWMCADIWMETFITRDHKPCICHSYLKFIVLFIVFESLSKDGSSINDITQPLHVWHWHIYYFLL